MASKQTKALSDSLRTQREVMAKAIGNMKKAAKAQASLLMRKGAKELFDAHPTLKSFSWRQYTPYWNDGDTCCFRSYHDYPTVTFASEGDGADDVEYEEAYTMKDDPKPHVAAVKDVVEFLTCFESDDLEHLFGDHCEVTVTRDDAVVSEFSHD